MKKLFKKLAVLATALCLALTGVLLVACNETPDDSDNGDNPTPTVETTYKVKISLPDGSPVSNVLVAYCDPVTDICNLPTPTDANGVAESPEGEAFLVHVLSGLPAGYTIAAADKDSYTTDWSSHTLEIVLSAEE